MRISESQTQGRNVRLGQNYKNSLGARRVRSCADDENVVPVIRRRTDDKDERWYQILAATVSSSKLGSARSALRMRP